MDRQTAFLLIVITFVSVFSAMIAVIAAELALDRPSTTVPVPRTTSVEPADSKLLRHCRALGEATAPYAGASSARRTAACRAAPGCPAATDAL